MVYVWGPACGRGRALGVEIYDLFKATGAPGSGAPGGTLGPRGGPPSEQLSRDFASALCTSGGQLVNVAESTHRLRLRTFLGTGRPRGLPETCEFLV